MAKRHVQAYAGNIMCINQTMTDVVIPEFKKDGDPECPESPEVPFH